MSFFVTRVLGVVDGVVIAEAKMVEELSILMQVQRFHLLYRINLIRLVRS